MMQPSFHKSSMISAGIYPVLGVVVWISLVSFPLLRLENPFSAMFDEALGNPSLLPFQIAGFLAFLIGVIWGHRSILLLTEKVITENLGHTVLIGGFLIVAIFSVMSAEPLSSMMYALAAGATVIIGSFFWCSSIKTLRLTWIACTLISATFLITAIAYHGFPEDRWIGGVHPNIYSGSAFALTVFGALTGNKGLRYVSLLLGLYFAALVSSRYALLAIIVFAVVLSYLESKQNSRTAGMGIPLLVGFLVLLWFFDLVGISEHLQLGLDNILLFSDEHRGIDSGASGRLELWLQGLEDIARLPLYGIGFRLGREFSGNHNAFINMFVEVGVIAGALLLCGLALTVQKLWRNALTPARSKTDLSRAHYSRVALAGSVGAITGMIFQPQIFNIGDTFAVTFFLCFTNHRLIVEELGKKSWQRRSTKWANSDKGGPKE